MTEPAPLLSPASDRLKIASRGHAPLRRLFTLILAERKLFVTATIWQVLQSLTALPFVAAIQYLFDHVIPYAQEHRAWWAIAAFAAS